MCFSTHFFYIFLMFEKCRCFLDFTNLELAFEQEKDEHVFFPVVSFLAMLSRGPNYYKNGRSTLKCPALKGSCLERHKYRVELADVC